MGDRNAGPALERARDGVAVDGRGVEWAVRYVRHPNYVAVFVELAALPLVHGAYLTAIAGALLHAAVLHRRVGLEESVLMADESYRLAFARKPRFIPFPWPMS